MGVSKWNNCNWHSLVNWCFCVCFFFLFSAVVSCYHVEVNFIHFAGKWKRHCKDASKRYESSCIQNENWHLQPRCIFSFRRYSFIMRQIIERKTSHKLNNRLRCVWGICQPSLHRPYSINATLIERLLLVLPSSSSLHTSSEHTYTLTLSYVYIRFTGKFYL